MLTTVERYKQYYKITDESQDMQIEMTIAQVSAEIESECKRTFGKADYEDYRIGSGGVLLLLKNYPVITASIPEITDFEIKSNEGMLYRKDGWLKGNEYKVSYSAGYVLPKDATTDQPSTLPADLEGACITLVNIRMEIRGSEHLKAETVGPLRSEYLSDIPVYIQSILNRYKRHDV